MVIYTCLFILPLDPWGLRELLKVKVATCPRTGGSYTPVCVCTHLHTYVHTLNTLCSRSDHLQKKKGTKKKKSKKRPPLSEAFYLPVGDGPSPLPGPDKHLRGWRGSRRGLNLGWREEGHPFAHDADSRAWFGKEAGREGRRRGWSRVWWDWELL